MLLHYKTDDCDRALSGFIDTLARMESTDGKAKPKPAGGKDVVMYSKYEAAVKQLEHVFVTHLTLLVIFISSSVLPSTPLAYKPPSFGSMLLYSARSFLHASRSADLSLTTLIHCSS